MSNRALATNQKAAAPALKSVGSAVLQRQCACGEHTLGGQCEECTRKHSTLQRHPAEQADPAVVPPIVYEVLRSPGQPLDPATRAFMEPRFGHDFSQVRVHADAKATESAGAVNAYAYTVSEHIVFKAGRYDPSSREGRRLLAHELTHVLQQRGGLHRAQGAGGENARAHVTHAHRPLLSRQGSGTRFPGAISRCREMGVPCPAPYATHGTICRLADCIPAVTARLPFAVSPGVCVYYCEDGKVCSCVLVGTRTSAVCTFTFCDDTAKAATEHDTQAIAERAVAMAVEHQGGGPGAAGGAAELPIRAQAKLEISAPGDQFEREADRVADSVLSTPGPPGVPRSANRSFFEPRFGHDFSNVRVHTDAKAAESAQAVNALAYAGGRDMVFGARQFSPNTRSGRRLLAHELTHVVQQQPQESHEPTKPVALSSMHDSHEREADALSTSSARLLVVHSPLVLGFSMVSRQVKGLENPESAPESDAGEKEEPATEVETEMSSDEFEITARAGPGNPPPKPVAGKSVKESRKKSAGSYAISINLDFPKLGSLDRSLTTAQISDLAGDENGTTAGLTQYNFSYQYKVRWSIRGRKYWIKAIKIALTKAKLKIHLTKENKPGSCADKALLRHEMHHVADYKQNLAKGEQALRENFAPGAWPDKKSPMDSSIISQEDVNKEMSTLIDRQIWEIRYNNWLDTTAWDYVDYPRMYADCPGMQPAVLVPKGDKGYPGKPPEVFAPPLPKRIESGHAE